MGGKTARAGPDVSARETILSGIRKSLKADASDASRRLAAESRITAHSRGTIPARAAVYGGEAMIAFVARLKAAGVTVAEAAHASDIPKLAADYLRANTLPARLRMGSDPDLIGLSWAPLQVLTGRAEGTDEVSISKAFAGVAETGTLVLTSGPNNPTTLNFLPETHIVVVRGADVVGGYEDVWDRLRAAGPLPRTVNWVSGPSRTADIEQTIVMGAHGPRRLHVILAG
jgi:L-lactate dehydrogenase complex protein LldG